jgi:hypothetical protein
VCTARSLTSGENLTDFFIVAPFSQELEPPQNPGRFTFFLRSVFSENKQSMGSMKSYGKSKPSISCS